MDERHPFTQEPYQTNQKVILPGYTPQNQGQHTDKTEIFNAQLAAMQTRNKSQALPPPTIIQSNARWQKDPAYQVLLVAIVLIIISGSIFTVVATNIFKSSGTTDVQKGSNQGSSYQTAPVQETIGQINSQPTFLPPGSNTTDTTGNTISSQPPTSGTPTIAVPTQTVITLSPTDTPINLDGILDVQVISYPQQINNNTTALIQINTGQANSQVALNAYYDLAPFFYRSTNQVTDNDGNATIDWPINLYGLGTRHRSNNSVARFIVKAQGQDGQFAMSSMITIQIQLNTGG